MVGNPPWVKVEWQEGGILGDYNPVVELRKLSASKLSATRENLFETYLGLRNAYLGEFIELEGAQTYLNAPQNYPLLKGSKANLYKCFLPQAWAFTKAEGVSGFLHPEGVYDDPNTGFLRNELYQYLRAHFQFDEVRRFFSATENRKPFSINIYKSQPNRERIRFVSISNLFATRTIYESFESSSASSIPGIKTENDTWETRGHPIRILSVDLETLALFSKLYDDKDCLPSEAKLPALHTQNLVDVLKKFATIEVKLGSFSKATYTTQHWNETNTQQDGTIRRETRFVNFPEKLILSGPHFFVANPLNKTPRYPCRVNGDYDVLDLTALPGDYLPRTNYVRLFRICG
jgi:hypothetical protein